MCPRAILPVVFSAYFRGGWPLRALTPVSRAPANSLNFRMILGTMITLLRQLARRVSSRACVGGLGRRALNVTPAGRVLPYHAAGAVANLRAAGYRFRRLPLPSVRAQR